MKEFVPRERRTQRLETGLFEFEQGGYKMQNCGARKESDWRWLGRR